MWYRTSSSSSSYCCCTWELARNADSWPSSWCNHQDPRGGPGKAKDTGHVPLPPPPPPPIISRRRLLSLAACPPHFHRPPAIPGRLAPASPISFQLLAAGTGWAGGRARTVSPRTGNRPPSPSPPRNIRRRVVPGVASPGQPNSAGQEPGGSRASCLRPGKSETHMGRPDPGAGIRGRAAGQLPVREGAERTPSAFPPPPTHSPAPRSPAVSRRAELGIWTKNSSKPTHRWQQNV
ncbi:translation initiation factor IF-2-like [Phacochoerus africanus]|uniref:translation initiation factor IF-2-like n=1 Tax=Phacochoerus africanus TaxID=41426 RepID=UPI001FD95693|nr:translation initiation factor IF-2-like [Phacochoerus africanus]